jgi:hypothetical protein
MSDCSACQTLTALWERSDTPQSVMRVSSSHPTLGPPAAQTSDTTADVTTATIIHDANNWLLIILSCSDWLLGQIDPANALRADVERIRASARSISEVNRRLLSRRAVEAGGGGPPRGPPAAELGR